MKIENIIRRVLREEQEEKRTTVIVDFDGFVNAFYDIEIRHKRTYRAVLVELIAHPKKNIPPCFNEIMKLPVAKDPPNRSTAPVKGIIRSPTKKN